MIISWQQALRRLFARSVLWRRMHFIVKGRALSHDKVRRAIDLSIEKYCSATAMMAKTATVTHDFKVIDTAK